MDLMRYAEKVGDAGSGKQKKEFVIETVKHTVKDKEAWAGFGDTLNGLIDVFAGFLFPKND